MKTNVILESSDRNLFGVTIRQGTKPSFLSITDLQLAYEKARWQNGWFEKNLSVLMRTQDFKERAYFVLLEKGAINLSFDMFIQMVEKETITKVFKGLGLWKTTGRGENKMVICDPYIWVLIAMELNPMLYAKVIIWLTDSLVFDRIDAGSEYGPMNSAIKSVVEKPDYTKYAKAMNHRVFGHHQTGMRNLASAKELRKIADIEKFVINAIEQGWIKTEEAIVSAIEKYK